jgi:hypothetical protein
MLKLRVKTVDGWAWDHWEIDLCLVSCFQPLERALMVEFLS